MDVSTVEAPSAVYLFGAQRYGRDGCQVEDPACPILNLLLILLNDRYDIEYRHI